MTELPVLLPTLQLSFYQRLQDAKKRYLLPALFSQVGVLDIGLLDKQLLTFAGGERLAFLARHGLRGELLFPVPYVLTTKPTLLGYYRLLLGFSQKEFYKGAFGKFKRLEEKGQVTGNTELLLPDLCRSLIASAWILAQGLPELSETSLNELSLLTLGPQLRGSRNVNLGAAAIRTVFALIKTIVSSAMIETGRQHLVVRSAADRIYRIEFSPDPDIAIRQVLKSGHIRNRIAIEVKGGTDFSNIHNRLGEAEKSHQKAKAAGFTEFWTIINVRDIDAVRWQQETPTTTELFYLSNLSRPQSTDYKKFREYLIAELGIR
jgi:hypothetical protein